MNGNNEKSEKVELIFDNPDNIKIKKVESFIDTKKIDEVEPVKRQVPFKGPFQEKMKVIRGGVYRIDGKPYELIPGDFIDGANLAPRKKEILVNTRFIVAVGT